MIFWLKKRYFVCDGKHLPTHDMPLPIVKGKAGGEGKLLCPSLRKDGQKLGSTQFLGCFLKRKFPSGRTCLP